LCISHPYCHEIATGPPEPGPTHGGIEKPSPTKRPRAYPDPADDDNFLSRKALEVYTGARKYGGQQPGALKALQFEGDLRSLEFDDDVGQYGHGPGYLLDCEDQLDDSLQCTYKCRNMVSKILLHGRTACTLRIKSAYAFAFKE
jgi:hypothetical protein